MLTADEICELAGLSPNSRQAWAKEGLLKQRRADFDETDALEAAIYAGLRAAAGPGRGKAAWAELRAPTQQLFLKTAPRAWIVIAASGAKRHQLISTPRQLARAIADGRPVHVIDVGVVIRRIRTEYRRVVNPKLGDRGEGVVRRLGGA